MPGGTEKILHPQVVRIIDGEVLRKKPASWRPLLHRETANHRLLSIAVAVHLALRELVSAKLADAWIAEALKVLREMCEPGPRKGLGAVNGSVELWTPSPHDKLHLDPIVAIALEAARAGHWELLRAALAVLGSYAEFCRRGSSEDGQAVLAGTRFWGVGRGSKMPETDADGWHHLPEGVTLSQTWDMFNREMWGLPQRDNRGLPGLPRFVTEMPSWRGLRWLAWLGYTPTAREPHTAAEYRFARTPDTLTVTLHGLDAIGVIHAPAPAVRAVWREPGKHLVSYAPLRMPRGLEEAA